LCEGVEQVARTRKPAQRRGALDEVAGVQLLDACTALMGQLLAKQDADEFRT
jgi:hypothetical protein